MARVWTEIHLFLTTRRTDTRVRLDLWLGLRLFRPWLVCEMVSDPNAFAATNTHSHASKVACASSALAHCTYDWGVGVGIGIRKYVNTVVTPTFWGWA